MISPYINTVLYSNVTLKPSQMNNYIYQNLKKNLIEDIKGKCFGDYGYIIDVFEIKSYKINTIQAENTSAACTFNVEFTCRLCRPLNNTNIICKVDRAHKVLTRCINGPINVIITAERVNPNNFFRDNNMNIVYKSEDGSKLLNSEDYVNIKIMNYKFLNKDTKILCIGFLESIATNEEKKEFFKEQYDNKGNIIPYDEYINSLKFKQEDKENIVTGEEETE